VRALGIPGSSGVSFLFAHEFHDATLNPHVPYARQALSIDENREIFKPEIWEEKDETEEARARGRVKQRWFPGVHSDIGGGYKETGLSDLSMAWMIEEATKIPNGLIVDPALKLQRRSTGCNTTNERAWDSPGSKELAKALSTGRGLRPCMKPLCVSDSV
jgi:uncharacterized protein (DUF2235 family)